MLMMLSGVLTWKLSLLMLMMLSLLGVSWLMLMMRCLQRIPMLSLLVLVHGTVAADAHDTRFGSTCCMDTVAAVANDAAPGEVPISHGNRRG